MVTVVESRPTVAVPGTAFVSLVGGSSALADDSDTTYVEVNNLDRVFSGDITVTFPALVLPDAPPIVDVVYIRSRYEQVSGTSIGRPNLIWTTFSAVALTAQQFVGVADGAVNDDGFEIIGGVTADFLAIPSSWDVFFDHDMFAACDFRLYELTMVVSYTPLAHRAPPVRRWPVDNGAMGPTRHFPRPASGRGAGGYR
jgi:hypothetical protein